MPDDHRTGSKTKVSWTSTPASHSQTCTPSNINCQIAHTAAKICRKPQHRQPLWIHKFEQACWEKVVLINHIAFLRSRLIINKHIMMSVHFVHPNRRHAACWGCYKAMVWLLSWLHLLHLLWIFPGLKFVLVISLQL